MDYTEVSDKEWEKIVLKSDDACFFNSPLWAKIMEKTYNYRTATRLYELDGKEILVPMMETNILGFKTIEAMTYGYGGFFSKSHITSDDIKHLIHQIIGGRNIIFDLVMPPLSNLPVDFEDPSIIKVKGYWAYTQILNLNKNYDNVWKNYKSKTRTHIRKAKKSSIKTRDTTSLDDFKTFYDIYAQASKNWGYKNPPIPFKLLENLHKYGSDHVKLSLAIKDDKIIAGLLSLIYSKTIYLYMGSFLPEYGRFNPARLLDNETIEKACSEGYKYVNFGSSGNNYELRKYKEGFGTEIIKTNMFKAYSPIGRLGLNIIKIFK
ncbi:MAG: GNAT family N-acetyltransferase [Methanobacterium sp.]